MLRPTLHASPTAFFAGIFKHHVVLWEVQQAGARLCWKLGDLYEVAGLARSIKKNSSQWIYARWDAWSKFLESIGCPLTLCRSAATGHVNEEERVSARRVVAFTSTPTYGLLALVARCAWGENAFQVEECGLAMQEYMASLLGPLRHGEFKFAFSFDMDNRWLPPSLWVTDAGIVVCCVDGTLDLRPVVQYSQSVTLPPEQRSVVQAVMAKLGGAVALNMSLIGLMSLVAKHMGSCKHVLRFFGELCFNLAMHLEAVLCPHHLSCSQVIELNSKSDRFSFWRVVTEAAPTMNEINSCTGITRAATIAART